VVTNEDMLSTGSKQTTAKNACIAPMID